MAQLLDDILAYKRKEVAAAKAAVREASLRAKAEGQSPVRGFTDALRSRMARGEYALIAEISRGPMRTAAPLAYRS